MIRRRRPLARVSILLCLAAPLAAESGPDEPLFPILERGSASMEIGGERTDVEFARTVAGPLVSLPTLVRRLGGRLETGPLGQAHFLTVGNSVFTCGADSAALTEGEEVIALRQPPVVGTTGLLVPLELLRETWGKLRGHDFDWREEDRTLVVERAPSRELAVRLDAVRLQGVTTLVFEFALRPVYRVEQQPGTVKIELSGDRLRFEPGHRFESDRLVEDVRLAEGAIRIDLKAEAVAEHYTLEDPFRLVFDVYRGGAVAARPPVAPRPRGGGVETIVLDPGHGGSEIGAEGPQGSLEKDLTLLLARTLKRRLETRLPVKVVLTRDQDAELPLDSRSALANQNRADLFISIHLNSSPTSGAHGAETYFLSLEASDERAARAAAEENRAAYGPAGPANEALLDLQLILWDLAQSHYLAESQKLAGLIQEELNVALELRNRGVKQAPFRVLMGAAMPAVLVELGFLSNPDEETLLNDPAYRTRLADTLVRAISRFRAARSVDAAALESR